MRAANEIGLTPKMFGGTMIGLLVTPLKVQLGPITNGLVIIENFAAAAALSIPGLCRLPQALQRQGCRRGIDPLGFALVPFGYAAGQILAKAVTETKGLDHDKLADYMKTSDFDTVAGDFSFAADGEWTKARQVWTQFQNVQPNDLDQFRDGKQPILWPPESKTGNFIYPYGDARKK